MQHNCRIHEDTLPVTSEKYPKLDIEDAGGNELTDTQVPASQSKVDDDLTREAIGEASALKHKPELQPHGLTALVSLSDSVK